MNFDDANRLLAAHRPSTKEEQTHHAAIGALLEKGPVVDARSHFEPGHLTASAFVVNESKSKLLLIWHTKLHRWLQPGGHLEPTDVSLEAAARRELREETGLNDVVRVGDGIFDVDVHVIPARPAKNEPAHEHHDVRFLFVSKTEDVTAGDDAGAARFVDLDAVSAHESDDSVMRAVQKIRALSWPPAVSSS